MLNDALLAPAQLIIDRGVERSTTAAALCARLEGKALLIDPGSAGLTMNLRVSEGRLLIGAGPVDASDACFRGSPLNLARLSGDDPEGVIRSGAVRMSGDPEVVEDFRALLEIIRPDWEELLSRITGDVVAHEAARAVSGLAGWARRARVTFGRSLAEYLTEESRDLVTEVEVTEFCTAVDAVLAGTERCEARLKNIRAQRKADA